MLIAEQPSSITEHDVEVISRKDDSVSEVVVMSTTEPLTTQYKISRDSDSTGNIPHEKTDSKQNDDEKDVVTNDISTQQQKEDDITMSTTRTISILDDEDDDDDNKNKCEDRDNNICDQHNVAQNEQPPSPPITLASSTVSDIQPLSSKQTTGLTEASLARQNKLMEHEEKQNEVISTSVSSKSAIPLSNSNNAIRAWAATLPEIPDSVHQTPVGPSHIFELNTQDSKNANNHHHSDSDFDQTKSSALDEEEANINEPQIQETKDVFTDTQKIAYVGLCAVTSLEVVHDFQGKEFTYARMSADNWHRKLMRTMYMHMDISPEEQKMIESLSRHDIRPTDLVHQFTAQGETTTVNMGGYQEVQQPEKKVSKDDEIHKEGETQEESNDQQRRKSTDTTASYSLSNNEINKERVQEQPNKENEESVIESRKSVSSKSDDNNELDTTTLKKASFDIDNTSTSSLQQQSTRSIGDRSIDVTLDREKQDEENNYNTKLLETSSSLSPMSELTISPKQSSTFTPAPSDTQISNDLAIDSSSYSTSNDDSIVNNDISNCEQNRRHSNINDDGEQRPKEGDTAQNGINGQFVIDLRWTVMCDLFLLCLSAENYDARSRVFIARMASYLELDWFQVIGFEKRITEHLMQDAGTAWETETTTSIATTQTTTTDIEVSIRNDVERKSRNKQRRKRRYIMIGLATIGGGLILGLSAGLMAPVIAGGIGTILTTVGVTGTSTFLGGTASIALITGGATAIGGNMGAKRMRKRMKMINTFEFSPVTVDENVSCIVSISGWLPKGATKDTAALPFSTLDPIMGDHYTLYWEPEMLEALGSGLKIFATEAVTFSIQQALAHTIMGALLAGLAWPLALTKLGYLVDNPWNNGLDRARLAGLILADSLMNRNLGARPVTLIGYSLGARVIFYCLLELARVNAYGLVENVALFGTPVSASKQQWKECTTVVAGRFINGYASNDWLLGFLFRASTAGLGNVAGLRPLKHIEGNRVQNVDCTDLVKGHLSYRVLMPKLLKRAGFVVNSEELPSAIERENEEDEFVIDLSGAKDLEQFRPATMVRGSSVSSLTSGKASIQYPPPKTKCHPPRTTEEAQQQQQQRQEEQSSRSPSPPTPPTQQDSSSTPIQQLSPKKQSPINSPKISSPLSTEDVSPKSSISIKTSTNNNDHNDDDDDHNISIPRQQQQHGEKQRQNGPDSSINDANIIKENTTYVNDMSDQDIIADIIAKAAAVSKSSGNYSSLSSGRASIAHHRPDSPTSTTIINSSSETTTTTSIRVSISADDGKESPSRRSVSTSSLFGKSLLFNKNRKKSQEEKGQQELSEQGIEVKELKSTLGRMVVPTEVANPMPKFTLEKPQYARVNR